MTFLQRTYGEVHPGAVGHDVISIILGFVGMLLPVVGGLAALTSQRREGACPVGGAYAHTRSPAPGPGGPTHNIVVIGSAPVHVDCAPVPVQETSSDFDPAGGAQIVRTSANK